MSHTDESRRPRCVMMYRMRPKKPLTMTSSLMSPARDHDDVTVTSPQDAEMIPRSVKRQDFLQRRWNVTTPPTDDSPTPRSLSYPHGRGKGQCRTLGRRKGQCQDHNPNEGQGHGQLEGQSLGQRKDQCKVQENGHSQDQVQGHSEVQDRDQGLGQDESRYPSKDEVQEDVLRQGKGQDDVPAGGEVGSDLVESVVQSSSHQVVTKTASLDKPQKPVKPINLRSSDRSRDVAGNNETTPSSQSGSRSRQRGSRSRSSDESVSPVETVSLSLPSLSAQTAHVSTSQQTRGDFDTTRGHNSLHYNVDQLTQWTITSTEPVLQSSAISLPSQQSSVCVESETTCGQISPCSNDKHLALWTTTSPQSFSQSSSVNLSNVNSEVDGGTACGQSSPRSQEEQSPDVNVLAQYSSFDIKSVCKKTAPFLKFLTSKSRPVDLISQPSDAAAETTCVQSSPRCNDEQQTQWTEVSHQVQVYVDADPSTSLSSECIEPPVISDLLPANALIRRGGSLQLTAQFTAFPLPDVSWYRANDLLTPGQISIIIIIIIIIALIIIASSA